MVDISLIRDIVAIAGVLIALTYYVLTLRNQKRTRQAQLLMELYESYRNPESRKRSMDIQLWDWNTLDEFFDRYSSLVNPDEWSDWEAIASFFHGVGVLLKADMIDIELLDRLLTNSVNRHWNALRMGQVLVEWRKRMKTDRGERDYWVDPEFGEDFFDQIRDSTFHGFDYLYYELVKYRKEHPITTT